MKLWVTYIVTLHKPADGDAVTMQETRGKDLLANTSYLELHTLSS